MKTHKKVQIQLYDYLRGELPGIDRRGIETHVAGCKKCSEELDSIRRATAMLGTEMRRPSDFRSDLYWQQFAEKVNHRIEQQSETEGSPFQDLLDAFLVHRKPFGVGFATALTLVVLAFGIWNLWLKNPGGQLPVPSQSTEATAPGTPNAQNVSIELQAQNYIEQSKVLLVGLMNTDTKTLRASGPALQREKEISRKLVNESAVLSSKLNDPSQRQLKELIADLQLILVQIANLGTKQEVPGIEIIKGGIEHNGILFKINLEQIQRTTKSAAAQRKTVKQTS